MLGTVYQSDSSIVGYFHFDGETAGERIYPAPEAARGGAVLQPAPCRCSVVATAVLSVPDLGLEWEAGCCLDCGVIVGPHRPEEAYDEDDWDIWDLTSVGQATGYTYNRWSLGPLGEAPTVVSLGMGTDSIAMLIGLKQRGIRPDLILFSDPGNERPETYAYLLPLSRWLEHSGFPPITIVRYRARRFKFHPYHSLAGNMLANRTLPSIAFYRKGCSVKAKGDVLDGHVGRTFGDVPCYRLIGYDDSKKDRKRSCRAQQQTDNGRGMSGSRTRPQDIFLPSPRSRVSSWPLMMCCTILLIKWIWLPSQKRPFAKLHNRFVYLYRTIS